ncbi:type II secretion system protein [Azonexus sp.]|uniref:type II secretion system protein n=1 Tax=Azonexus sp. TaxID=1872668 RepID=UPI0035B0F849
MKTSQKGFTLIEIAIVLVIIGLLLGGVMKGQELITQSKIRSIEKEFDGVTVAVLNYRDRYKALPGDDSQTEARWVNSGKGNGNGKIDDDFNSTTATDESRLLWQHLRAAGLITAHREPTQQPTNAAGGIIGVQTEISNGGSKLLEGTVVCTTNLAASVANAIDAAQDEGLPDKGSVRGFPQTSSNTPDYSSNLTAYVDDGKTLYTLCKQI